MVWAAKLPRGISCGVVALPSVRPLQGHLGCISSYIWTLMAGSCTLKMLPATTSPKLHYESSTPSSKELSSPIFESLSVSDSVLVHEALVTPDLTLVFVYFLYLCISYVCVFMYLQLCGGRVKAWRRGGGEFPRPLTSVSHLWPARKHQSCFFARTLIWVALALMQKLARLLFFCSCHLILMIIV